MHDQRVKSFLVPFEEQLVQTVLRYCTCQGECDESEINLSARVLQGEAEALTHHSTHSHIFHTLIFIYIFTLI